MRRDSLARGRKPLVAGNWKMNGTYGEAVRLSQEVCDLLRGSWRSCVEVLVCPPFTALRGVSNVIAFSHSWAKVGAQDCFWEPSGAFTGAVSIPMIKDLDCTYCIVGHSERRSVFGEGSDVVARKAAALAQAQVTPIVCVGEGRDVYESGNTAPFVSEQLAASLEGVDASRSGLVVAYEPVWAIGSGISATPEHAQAVAQAIRAAVDEVRPGVSGEDVRVLYGGSVKSGNVGLFTACDDVDGVLVGGASLHADEFCDMVRTVAEQAGA